MPLLRIRSSSLALFLFAASLIANPTFLASQERNNDTTLQHRVTVTLKLIQVYVTDKKGNPAVDLTKEDFLIRDNGKDKQITEFEKHILHLSPSEAEVPRTTQEKKTSASRDLMHRKFFLLFDFVTDRQLRSVESQLFSFSRASPFPCLNG